MESAKQITMQTSKGRLTVQKQVRSDQHVEQFNVYETSQTNTVCLALAQPHSHPIYKLSTQRIKQCYKCIKQGESSSNNVLFQNYDEQYQYSMPNNKNFSILIYQEVYANNSVQKLARKLTESQILGLAIFCIRLVCKMKQAKAYMGSFFPNRIYLTGTNQFVMIGGQFFTPNCTAEEFMKGNKNISADELIKNWKYQPPEIFNDKANLSYLSDLFVVGCILYQIITNHYPFGSFKELEGGMLSRGVKMTQLINQICNKMLCNNPGSRTEPEEILSFLQLELAKTVFSTCKLSLEQTVQETSIIPNFFNNFQQFIMKCTTETEGWFLYYCENCQDQPNQKYLEQILIKISKKSQKIHKLVNLFEKCAAKPIQQLGSGSNQDNSCTVLKMGMLMLNLLRRLALETTQNFHTCFSKVSAKIVGKKCSNKLIPIIFKIIAFKVSLAVKFPELSGDFHVTIEKYCRLTIESWEYLCQYCLKILGYLQKLGEELQLQNLKKFQVSAVRLICEEVYDGISTLLFGIMAAKKDKSLKICNHLETSEQGIRKIDGLGTQIVKLVGKLCSSHHIFTSQDIYSVNSDYYEYQEELCLMYCPIATSYEYFYIDRNHYKGLTLPKNYATSDDLDFDHLDEQHQQLKYANRQPMSSRGANSAEQFSSKSKNTKAPFNHNKINSNNRGQHSENDSTLKSKTDRAKVGQSMVIDREVLEFEQFLTNVHKKEENNTTNTTNPTFNSSLNTNTNGNKSNSNNIESEQSWFEPSQHNIYSYEWLKKTEKIISKHFQKPELDPIIYVLYDDICRGLRLHELIEVLGKNKKVIVDPNQVLFQKVIGSGSAGEVYIGKYKQAIVAIKKVKTDLNPNALKEFEREVLTYIKIKQHPNLVSLVGLTKYNQDYFLLTQFCEGGSLFDLLHKRVNEISLSWKQRISIALDIARGMGVLHYMNPPVIHRDMKSLNVFMVNRNKLWSAKVADFGLSRSPDTDMMTSALGTLHWMAPELLCNKQYSLKVDVYSFGVVLWEICSRRTPYHNIGNQMGIVKHVVLDKGRPLLDLIEQGCPKLLIELMKRCWREEPDQRPYFPEIIGELNKIIL